MTPKEKAIELFEKMYYKIQPDELGKDQESAKECTLIAVDEVLNSIDWDYYEGSAATELKWWREVKQEIEKL